MDKNLSLTIQMKATEKHFPVVLFIMKYKVVLTTLFPGFSPTRRRENLGTRLVVITVEPIDKILSVTIQMKATEKHVTFL